MTSYVTERSGDRFATIPIETSGGQVHIRVLHLVSATGESLVDPVSGGLKVAVVSGGGGSGGTIGDSVDVTDRAGRVLGRVGVDLLTDAVGLATDAGLASVFARLHDVTGTVAISNFPATQPVSAAALPLPAGASTEATAAASKAVLDTLFSGLGALYARQADGSQRVVVDSLPAGLATDAGLAAVFARLGDGTQHVIVDSLPIGLATAAKQDTGNASCASIDGKITACNTGAVTVAASALPTGAATGAKQDTCNASLASIDGKITACNTGAVVVATCALPAGASTSAKQDTGNTSLASIDGKLVACNTGAVVVSSSALPTGAATAANQTATQPRDVTDRAGRLLGHVTIDNATIAVTGAFFQATQPVSGTFWQATQPISAAALPLPTGAATEATLATRASDRTTAAAPFGVRLSDGAAFIDPRDTSDRAARLLGHVTVDNASLAITAAALPLPAGAATEATLALIKAKTDNLDVALSTRAVTGLTDAQLRASAVPISAAALPLPAGAATQATLATLALDATLTGGTTKAIQRTAAKGTTVAGDMTGSAIDANTHAAHVKLKDEGRVRFTATFDAVAPAVADTLLSLVKNLGGVVSGGATSIAVTAGKRLRITHVTFSLKSGAAAAAFATLTLRSLSNGPTVIGSPIIDRVDLGNTGATIGAADRISIQYPEGLEFSGTETIGASLAAQAVTNVISVCISGYEYTP